MADPSSPITWNTVLGLAGFSAVVSAATVLLGHFLKEVIFARSLEEWKSKRATKACLAMLEVPLFQSGRELLTRLQEIYDDFPIEYLNEDALATPTRKSQTNDTSDPHFRHYKLISTLYRFCAFWGWVELFRREIVTVKNTQSKRVTSIESILDKLREDIADGQLNNNDDWTEWRDRLIFREELRAIGERVISQLPARGVMGYGAFCDLISEKRGQESIAACSNFFFHFSEEKDFRKDRILRMIVHLHELLEVLDKQAIPKRVSDSRLRYALPKYRTEKQGQAL